ncbi:MAG: hypothetical protein RLZZ553_45 [Verrucomicrobiota bacterium]|jgi:hypothetical protein
MRLEDVTMEIRPRTDWEAVDSGFAMVRRDFWRCWLLWWMSLIPVWLLIYPLSDAPWLWLLIMLWAKWNGCRMILHQLSRRLFGENPAWHSLWREIPRAWVRRFFYRMILARFSPWKPLSAAVEELEGLRGEKFRIRMNTITRKGEGIAILLTFVSGLATLLTSLALLLVGMLFFPESVQERWWNTFESGMFEEQPGFVWLLMSCVTVACSLVDGFITGAGFGLYVNSRTWIEGWDVELAFKRIANRLRQQVLIWTGAVLLFIAPNTKSEEIQQWNSPRATIEEIKKHEDFVVHKEKYRVPKSTSLGGSMSLPAGLAEFFQILGYLILGVFVIFLIFGIIWIFYRASWLRPKIHGRREPVDKARVVMGMEVTIASLPADLLASADALWRSGRHLQAMGLLYRGSLAWWIEAAQVDIRESDTEGDCLARVEKLHHPHGSYFQMLTQAWQLGAYAQHFPPQESWQELCKQWPFAERRSV